MGCKSAPNALAEQVPGDVSLMTVLLISNEFTTNTGQILENSGAKLGCSMHVTNCSSIWVECSGNQELQVVLSVLVAESQSHTSHHLHETQMTDMEF